MRKNSIKSFLVFLWNCSVDYFVQLVDFLFHSKDKLYCLFNAAPKVLSIPETIQLVIDKKLSVSRFGDGEIKLISGKSLLFQTFKFSLQQKLIHVLSSSAGSHLICLSDVFLICLFMIIRLKNIGKNIYHIIESIGIGICKRIRYMGIL